MCVCVCVCVCVCMCVHVCVCVCAHVYADACVSVHACPNSWPVQVEGEDGLGHEPLTDSVVEGGDHPINRDLLVAHSQDTVKLGSHEGDTRLLGGLSKRLFLDGDITNLQTQANGDWWQWRPNVKLL